MAPEVVVYTRDRCGYCRRAKQLLNRKNVEYTEINISENPERKEEMVRRSEGAKTFPQIFIGEQHVGGCDDLYAFESKGVLDTMLDEESDGTADAAEEAVRNVIILGSGSAGLTAALYNSRADLDPLVIEGEQPGGQLTITTDVENYPGFPEGIQGPELMDRKKEQAARFGTDFVPGNATAVDLESRPFTVEAAGDTYRTRSLIVATGASAKWLGLESEERYRGSGVSACATCDGFFFQDDEVLVIGGGDTAMEEALFLTKFAKRVRILHRRDELRASEIMANRARDNDTIEFLWNTELVEVLGDGEAVTGARVVEHPEGHPKEKWEQGDPDVTERTLDCQGVFLGIGHKPNTELFEGELAMDETGYLRTEDEVFTDVEGVFAAGDVQDQRYRQAVTAAGSGCKAAMEAEEYLNELALRKNEDESSRRETASAAG